MGWWRSAAIIVSAIAAAGCRSHAAPSFILVVLDTTRADVVGLQTPSPVTPHLDALARTGVRFDRAYSNANWTLPSHATLFTGLLPSRHGIRCERDALSSDVETLAEVLSRNGYETVGVSESRWINAENGLARGFSRFVPVAPAPASEGPTARDAIASWLDGRHGDNRPFFLFVNLLDAHQYIVREPNPFFRLVDGDPALARGTSDTWFYLCRTTPDDASIALLRRVYLANVNVADEKLGQIVSLFDGRKSAGPVVTMVTADHGEYFGEHGLIGHETGVGNPVLHVPLVIGGLPGEQPRTISRPVQLRDVFPSVLTWAGIHPGEEIPLFAEQREAPVLAEYRDPAQCELPTAEREWLDDRRSRCHTDDRVNGDARVLIDYPFELTTWERYPPSVFDVRADADETRDLANEQRDLRTKLLARLDEATRVLGPARVAERAALTPEIERELRSLGYLGGEARPEDQKSSRDTR